MKSAGYYSSAQGTSGRARPGKHSSMKSAGYYSSAADARSIPSPESISSMKSAGYYSSASRTARGGVVRRDLLNEKRWILLQRCGVLLDDRAEEVGSSMKSAGYYSSAGRALEDFGCYLTSGMCERFLHTPRKFNTRHRKVRGTVAMTGARGNRRFALRFTPRTARTLSSQAHS